MTRCREGTAPSTHQFFRQNTRHGETNRRDPHGHVEQSLLDSHAYASYPEFRSAAKHIDRALFAGSSALWLSR